MRVALDLRWLQQACCNSPEGGLGGIAVFSRNLWIGLAEADSDVELVAILREGRISSSLAAILERAPRAQTVSLGPRHPFFKESRGSRRLAGRHPETEWIGMTSLSRLGIDVLHRLDHTAPPRRADFATAATVHDLIGLADPPRTATVTERLVRPVSATDV